MSVLDVVDDVASKIAIVFVAVLVGLMALCALAMVVTMWVWVTNETGLIVGTVWWLISVVVAFSVSWTGFMRSRD